MILLCSGNPPPARKLHSATAAASEGEIIIFGGQSLESGSDLNDIYYMIKVAHLPSEPALKDSCWGFLHALTQS